MISGPMSSCKAIAGPSRASKSNAKRKFSQMASGDDNSDEDYFEHQSESEVEFGVSKMVSDEEDDDFVSGKGDQVGSENGDSMSKTDVSSNGGTQDSELFVSKRPMEYNNVSSGMWVMVFYEGERFLGNVDRKEGGKIFVKCLEMPFGIRTPQLYENISGSIPYYDNVFKTNAQPHGVQVDSDRKKSRKYFFTY